MNPDRSTIFATLSGSAQITALLSSSDAVFHRVAPATAEPPFIVFDKQSGGVRHAFGEAAISDRTWLVKAVDRASSATRAEDIDALLDDVLRPLGLLRVTDVDYPEQDGAETWHHVGGVFRWVSDRNA